MHSRYHIHVWTHWLYYRDVLETMHLYWDTDLLHVLVIWRLGMQVYEEISFINKRIWEKHLTNPVILQAFYFCVSISSLSLSPSQIYKHSIHGKKKNKKKLGGGGGGNSSWNWIGVWIWAPFHKGLRLIACFPNTSTRFAIELQCTIDINRTINRNPTWNGGPGDFQVEPMTTPSLHSNHTVFTIHHYTKMPKFKLNLQPITIVELLKLAAKICKFLTHQYAQTAELIHVGSTSLYPWAVVLNSPPPHPHTHTHSQTHWHN